VLVFVSIGDVVPEAELIALREVLRSDAYVSGKTTAGGHARQVKQNEQLATTVAAPVLKKIESLLLAHPVFKAAAMPKSLVKLMVSRYRPGMHYGLHVDEPMMNGVRTDLSFTLFLSGPEDCDGGELVVEENAGDRDFKLPAGSLILYPTTTLHRVAAVTRGERLAIVGWVRSLVRDHANRELIFDLENSLAALRNLGTDRAILDRLYKVRANLIRKWAED
jgi:PKHD-type hydroxylase